MLDKNANLCSDKCYLKIFHSMFVLRINVICVVVILCKVKTDLQALNVSGTM